MTKTTRRILEIAPGLISWNVILFLVWGAYLIPEVTAYFVLAFSVFWAYKSLGLLMAVIIGHLRMGASQQLNWMEEVKGFGADWRRVRHVILILVANEPYPVYQRTVENLARQTFPLSQIAVVLATEERCPAGREGGEKLRQEWESKFGGFIVATHPANIPGEIKGKSSNEAWAAKQAKKELVDQLGWDIRYMTITSNDADALLDPQYFACLAYKFLDDPNRYDRFWQPAVVFYNNIWRLPAPVRVINVLSSIVHIGGLVRKDRLVSFSNYSAPFQTIHEVGYWDTDVIPEDYRIFFKVLFNRPHPVEVEPIYLPSSADAAESDTLRKTLINNYQQQKRWAWGVSDIPVFIGMFMRHPQPNFLNKLIRLARVTIDHQLWPVSWFVITLGARISAWVNPAFTRTSIGYFLPQLSSYVLSAALVALVFLLIIESRHRPTPPRSMPRWQAWLTPLEFLLMPIVGFFLNALPGLDAHTRLMLGKYIEYRVTEKVS